MVFDLVPIKIIPKIIRNQMLSGDGPGSIYSVLILKHEKLRFLCYSSKHDEPMSIRWKMPFAILASLRFRGTEDHQSLGSLELLKQGATLPRLPLPAQF